MVIIMVGKTLRRYLYNCLKMVFLPFALINSTKDIQLFYEWTLEARYGNQINNFIIYYLSDAQTSAAVWAGMIVWRSFFKELLSEWEHRTV